MSVYDVAVVGGGIIGGSIAFELAREKLRVLLLDRQQPGLEASWAAAGMLAPGPEAHDALPLVPLAKESLRLYPEFISAIEDASGKSTAFVREGTLEIFPGPDGESQREKMAAEYRRFDLPIERISFEAARKLEPALGTAARVAAWLPEEAIVDPRWLTEAVIAAGRCRGVEVRHNASVTSVLHDGKRCHGVLVANERVAAKQVVLAAGAYSGGIEGMAPYAPTRPIRGQMLALRSHDLRLTRVLRSGNGYLVPRRDGRIIAGSTLEDAGFARNLTPGGMRSILDAALELVPGLAGAEIVETWTGLRPGTPDTLPILGPTDVEGLFMATGHYRNGILLTPVTARLLREWILGNQTSFDAAAFSPLRFSAQTSRTTAAKGASARP